MYFVVRGHNSSSSLVTGSEEGSPNPFTVTYRYVLPTKRKYVSHVAFISIVDFLAYLLPIVNTIIPIVNAITPIVDFFCNYTDCKRFRCCTDCKQHHTDCKCYKPRTDNSWISKYEFILRSARRNIKGSAKALGANRKDDNE